MILATAGHIDHGKTALVRALTGIDADRLPEEKRRGLTIDLGFAYASLPDGTELGFVDVPGHERFLPNMLAGVLSIDRVLLIVAADDGPRPQTIEHLEILELVGIAEVTGIVTKIDRVPAERLAAVTAEVAARLAGAGYGGSPILAVSSISGDGIAALTRHLCDSAAAAERARATRPPTGRFRLPIDRVFSLPGIGTVVTGTIVAGSVAAGDRLVLSPSGVAARVRGVHAQNRPVERAAAGERCALNIAGDFPETGGPHRGAWLIAPELHAPAQRLDLRLTVSRNLDAPLRDGLPVHVHLGTADVVGRVAALGARAIAPGDSGFVQLDLEHRVGALYGDRVILRDHAARHTIGGGRVLDPFAPRRGRARPARLAMLDALAEPEPAAALHRLLAVEGVVDLAAFALSRNLTPAKAKALSASGGFAVAGPPEAPVAVSEARLAALGERLGETFAEYHRAQPEALGPPRSWLLRRHRNEAPETALDAALALLVAAGRVRREGSVLRLAEHQPRLAREDERLWERVRPLIAAGELRPPRVREIAAALALEPADAEKFLRRVERFGRLAAVAGNRYFLPETVARLAEIAHALTEESPERSFSAAAYKERSGIGRNLTIEILEYLDRIGATRRVGDVRIALRRGADLFG